MQREQIGDNMKQIKKNSITVYWENGRLSLQGEKLATRTQYEANKKSLPLRKGDIIFLASGVFLLNRNLRTVALTHIELRGRPLGYSPSGGKCLTKRNKAWSMPSEDWEWLESQPNQSQVIRQAIAEYRNNHGNINSD